MTGESFVLQSQLSKLRRYHKVAPEITAVPASPIMGSAILHGCATDLSMDSDRTKLDAGALWWDRPPRLHAHHDETKEVGSVDVIRWNLRDQLVVTCTVEDEQAAALNSFSIGMRIEAYTIRESDRPSYWAQIHRAELTEISLCTHPANPRALVTRRTPRPVAPLEFYDLIAARLLLAAKTIDVLRSVLRSTPPSPPPSRLPVNLPVHRGSTQFSQLVAQLNQME